MKYVVTGISRLTGEREVISSPRSRKEADRIVERAGKRRKMTAYTRLKVEPAEREGVLW